MPQLWPSSHTNSKADELYSVENAGSGSPAYEQASPSSDAAGLASQAAVTDCAAGASAHSVIVHTASTGTIRWQCLQTSH